MTEKAKLIQHRREVVQLLEKAKKKEAEEPRSCEAGENKATQAIFKLYELLADIDKMLKGTSAK